MQKINNKYIKLIVSQALREDLRPLGDITTRIIANKKASGKIVVGQNCIVGGIRFAKEAFKILDRKIIFKQKIHDGEKVKRGKVLAIVQGNAKNILRAERVALNFIGLISGVATITNKFVKKINGKSCKIYCTRKTLPNLRAIQKYGVRLGGGANHRFNLSDEILIKDNHVAINKNIKDLVLKSIKNRKGKKITVEIDNIAQLKKIIGLKFNRVLFDNMSIKDLKKAVKISKGHYETEASGGITLKNVKNVSYTGVKRISVGQITHSAPAIDCKLEFIS